MSSCIGSYVDCVKIGSGQYGTVYRCKDPAFDRWVAIKRLGGEVSDLKEARLVAQLDHENIVRVYHHLVVDNAPHIVMEFVEGVDLRAMIRNRTPLPVAQKVGIVAQVARALQHAHDKGIVHCDVKPANILVRSDLRVKVADFGIARLLGSEVSKSQSTTGTPAYMAPEQFSGKVRADKQSDVYACGVVLFELLLYRLPFVGSPIEVMWQKIQGTPPSLADLDGTEAEWLEDVILRCLERAPERRYASAAELVQALERGPATSEPRARLEVPLPGGAAPPDPTDTCATQVAPWERPPVATGAIPFLPGDPSDTSATRVAPRERARVSRAGAGSPDPAGPAATPPAAPHDAPTVTLGVVAPREGANPGPTAAAPDDEPTGTLGSVPPGDRVSAGPSPHDPTVTLGVVAPREGASPGPTPAAPYDEPTVTLGSVAPRDRASSGPSPHDPTVTLGVVPARDETSAAAKPAAPHDQPTVALAGVDVSGPAGARATGTARGAGPVAPVDPRAAAPATGSADGSAGPTRSATHILPGAPRPEPLTPAAVPSATPASAAPPSPALPLPARRSNLPILIVLGLAGVAFLVVAGGAGLFAYRAFRAARNGEGGGAPSATPVQLASMPGETPVPIATPSPTAPAATPSAQSASATPTARPRRSPAPARTTTPVAVASASSAPTPSPAPSAAAQELVFPHAVAVRHEHSFGRACFGDLVLGADRIAFASHQKDWPLATLRVLVLKDGSQGLQIKDEDGNYNFRFVNPLPEAVRKYFQARERLPRK